MPASHSDAEFVACCLVAREHGLNPLTKEIYFMKTKSGTIQPYRLSGWVGAQVQRAPDVRRHGNLRCQRCRRQASGRNLHHVPQDRAHPVKITEDLEECAKHGGPVWKTHPRRMLRHRALTQAARYAFGFCRADGPRRVLAMAGA